MKRSTVGLLLFLLGLVLPAFIPLLYLLPLNAWWLGALTALFALGLPELIWFIAMLVVGKEGFQEIKAMVKSWVKRWTKDEGRRTS